MDIKTIEEKIELFNAGISRPAKPKFFGKDYEFPSDFSKLDSNTLSSWLSKLAEWQGYTMRLLGDAEVILSILEESFNSVIAKYTAMEIDSGKRATKDYILGKVLNIKEWEDLREKIISKRANCILLKRLTDLYSLQFSAVSREVSRRSMEIKSIQKGISNE